MSDINTATRAKELLENELLKDVFQRLEKSIFEQLIVVPMDDDAKRRDLCERIVAFRAAQEMLRMEIQLVAQSARQPMVLP